MLPTEHGRARTRFVVVSRALISLWCLAGVRVAVPCCSAHAFEVFSKGGEITIVVSSLASNIRNMWYVAVLLAGGVGIVPRG